MQGLVLHASSTSAALGHAAPPTSGSVRLRVRVRRPVPHVCVHVSNEPHEPTMQSRLQTRSTDAVGETVSVYPAAQGAVVSLQAAPLSVAEKVAPATHGAHVRSAVAEPAMDWPWPTAHVRQAVHVALPAVALKVSLVHAVHSRLDEGPALTVSYSPAPHVVTA